MTAELKRIDYFIIVFYKYINNNLVKNEGWYPYSRNLISKKIKEQTNSIRYKALIRTHAADYRNELDVWHELDLTKSEYYKTQKKLSLLDKL